MYEGGMYMSVVLCSVTSGYVPCFVHWLIKGLIFM